MILPPCGQRFLDQLARLASGRDVVGADVALALAVRRVAVVREHERLLRRVVQHRRLVRRIDGTDRDAVHALRQQVVDDALLRRGGAVAEPELDATSGSSASAFSVPLRAIVQKSAALFVTKASLWTMLVCNRWSRSHPAVMIELSCAQASAPCLHGDTVLLPS